MEGTRVSIGEFEGSPGAVAENALREPVTITKQGRDHLVLLSAGEYARLKRRDRKVHTIDDLPEEWLEAVEKAQVPEGFEHLDRDLEQAR